MSKTVLEAKHVSLYYNLDFHRQKRFLTRIHSIPIQLQRRLKGQARAERRFWALQDVSFAVREGEVLGVIGRNGSGKSTLLRVLAGILTPDKGEVIVNGQIGALLSLGAGFQPVLTGRENIFLRGLVLGFSRGQINEKLHDIIEFSGLERFIDAPVRSYSSGMRARLGFSIAIHFNPEILLLDEVMAAGDAAFRKHAGNLFTRFRGEHRTIVICTHNMSQILENCHHVIWLEQGKIIREGEPKEVVEAYVAATEKRRH
ncbi:MAG: ABC transporter ATP-binding protein [Deltaproteobacteria bacterium]|nr:ABC transporter ATP-binding protein [Deltaproteobacteria bacterium]